MDIVLLIFSGIVGGFLGGMGMGGGTLLIPLLTLLLGLSQHLSQAINLISFIPMAIIALIIHSKNKLTKFKMAFHILLFGLVGAVLGSYFASQMEGNFLKRAFGIFLIILGLFSLSQLIFFPKKDK